MVTKPIPDWPGYLATEYGEIVSTKFEKQRVLKLGRHSNGYLLVCLYRDDYKKTMSVHRLVWLAFRGPIPPDREIAHDDGDPRNNKLSNLKCVTHKENCAYQKWHGTIARGERNGSHTQPHRRPRGERNGSAKLTADKVREIRALYQTSNYSQRELAARFGVSQRLISRIVRGKIWSHL